MTPDEIKTSYRQLLDLVGETVSLRRYSGSGDARTSTDYDVFARVVEYLPNDLIGSIQQGDRKLIILAEDVASSGFTLPIKTTDKVVVRGKELAIQAVDDNTRRVAGTIIAYDVTARG